MSQTKRKGGLTVIPDPSCKGGCGKVMRGMPFTRDEFYEYCEACCPHEVWYPYAGTGDDICKQCGGLF